MFVTFIIFFPSRYSNYAHHGYRDTRAYILDLASRNFLIFTICNFSKSLLHLVLKPILAAPTRVPKCILSVLFNISNLLSWKFSNQARCPISWKCIYTSWITQYLSVIQLTWNKVWAITMYVSLRKRPLCNQMSIDEEELIHQN